MPEATCVTQVVINVVSTPVEAFKNSNPIAGGGIAMERASIVDHAVKALQAKLEANLPQGCRHSVVMASKRLSEAEIHMLLRRPELGS